MQDQHTFEIVPGILEQDWASIEAKLKAIQPFARAVHIDLIDGKFAQNTTFLDPTPFKEYSQQFDLELHMMVDNPFQFLKPWADVGCKRFIGHIEKMPDPVEFVAEAQLLGGVGLAIDAKTPVESLKVDLDDLDSLLVMTVQAGFSGQAFMPDMLVKVKALRAKTDIPIEVDGGINETTILEARDAGANRFVVTSCLFGATDPMKKYQKLRESVKKKT